MLRLIPTNLNFNLVKNNLNIGYLNSCLITKHNFKITDNKLNSLYISKIYIEPEYRGINLSLYFLKRYENIITNKYKINEINLDAINFDNSYKLVNLFSKIDYEIDYNKILTYRDRDLIPMTKKINN